MKTAQAATAIDSFHQHRRTGRAQAQHERILAFVSEHQWQDWSIGELAQALQLEKSTISARVRELLDLGQLQERPQRKDRCSGIRVRPVSLPRPGKAQGELFQ